MTIPPDLQDALARAKAREGKTTPAPWVLTDEDTPNPADAWHDSIQGGAPDENDDLSPVLWVKRGMFMIGESADSTLITDAPALQALAIAQDALITQLKADWEAAATDHLDATKALEAARARVAELQREIDRLCRVHKITG